MAACLREEAAAKSGGAGGGARAAREECEPVFERKECCEAWERRAGLGALEVVGRRGASVKGSLWWVVEREEGIARFTSGILVFRGVKEGGRGRLS